MKLLLFVFLVLSFGTLFAQRGKDGNYTATALNHVVNTYTTLTSNSNSGSTSLNVVNSALVGANFTGNLAQGDLVMIVQMQGINVFPWDADVINIHLFDAYTANQQVPPQFGITTVKSHQSANYQNGQRFGKVLEYGNVGNFELREVLNVAGNTINLTCALDNTYEAHGVVQVVRVPRYANLTINANSSIVCPNWNGSSGGVLAIEVDGNLILNAAAGINANARGFRPGLALNSSATGSATQHGDGQGNGSTALGTNNPFWGALKGESIVGDTIKYRSIYSQFGRGAIANGGGGGGMQNSGGGGGSNIGDTVGHTGKGIPQRNGPNGATQYDVAWNLEKPAMATTLSGGGGRGGYSYSTSSQNPLTIGPNRSNWSGDARKENGGYGGHPLVYNFRKMFMGGGGGAGGQDSGQAGNGGFGGGIIHLTVYGTISGNGSIEANGGAGGNSNPNNQSTSFSNPRRGNDGAGGGGGGGFITIKNSNPIPATMSINAIGGKGGDVNLSTSIYSNTMELCGPGGGGAGGGVSIAAGTASINVSGGLSGGTFANGGQNTQSASFPMNGATGGGVGMGNLSNPTFDINAANSTICGNSGTTLTATVTGTLPSGTNVSWYTAPFGGSPIATGLTFNTPNLTSTTTYYVGVCPGTFRKPVVVTVGANPIISGTAVITNATCNTGGSLTGLSVSGGTAPYTYTWNGSAAAGPSLSNVSANTYTLIVTDQNGCTATSGPHTITGGGGPSITGTAVITPATCTAQGSITGLVVNAPAGVATYEWNGTLTMGPDLSAVAGSYTLVVTDNAGCNATSGPHIINTTAGPTVGGTPIITNATCNAGGSISGITVSGGVTPYTFSWTNTTQTSIDVNGLAANSYTLTVSDANGCIVTSGPHTISMASTPTIAGTPVITHQGCLVMGSISGLTASGGVGTLSYTWNGATAANENLASAVAGNYTLVVTDQNGCTASSGPHTINAPVLPTIAGTAIISPITCTSPGTITGLSVNGGTAPYTYLWNNVPSTANFSTTTAGNYTLTIVDASGCTVTSGPHAITTANTPSFGGTPVVTNANCNAGGSISGITVAGGVAPFVFSWTNTTQTTLDLTGLAPNAYTLTVTDANGCVITSGPHTIAMDSAPIISGTPAISHQTCIDLGSISGLTATGGFGTLSYQWNGTTSTNANLTAEAGSYLLVVTDQNGCTATSGPHTINPPVIPTIAGTPIITPVNCNTTGGITGLTVSGGTAPYNYFWNATASTIDLSTNVGGTFTFEVVDANGCSATSGPYTIAQTGAPVLGGTPTIVDVTCNTSGSITGITVSGGTAPYSYAWNGVNSADQDLLNVGAGTYTLVVTDANGCTATSGPHTVNAQGSLPVISGTPVIVNATCLTGGSITGLVVAGGQAPYTYEWNGELTTNTTLTNAAPGTYVLEVEDDNGCVATSQPFTIGAPNTPTITGTPTVTNASCLAGGSINGVTISGGTAPYTYSWNNGQFTSLDIINLSTGQYTLTITDANGCTITGSPITVGEDVLVDAQFSYSPQPVMINEIVTFQDQSIGNIVQWNWTIDTISFTSQNPNYTFTKDGFYTVTLQVVDANGCTDFISMTIEVISETIVPNVITANGDGINDLLIFKGLVPNTSLLILNRWGNVIYQTDNYDNTWNGTDMSGNFVTEGVYTYSISIPNGDKKHGFIHVVSVD